jgi:glycosyltransferase involved in cell wall biosynthesis
MKKLSIIIPAFNEANNIRIGVLNGICDYLKEQNYDWEVIVSDDGSTDGTVGLTQEFAKKNNGFSVLPNPHRGKAGAVISGMLKASGDIVLFSDMDQATPINEIEKFLPRFDQGFDVVIGSRRGRKGANIIRKAMAYGFMFLRTIILRLPFKDTQCGFKAFKKESVKPILKKLQIFSESSQSESGVTAGFDIEVLYIARKLGYKIAEVQVEWEEKGTRGDFGVNPIKDSWEALRDLIKIRLNALQGKYIA